MKTIFYKNKNEASKVYWSFNSATLAALTKLITYKLVNYM